MSLSEWINRYNKAGIPTIPLREQTKYPSVSDWQALTSAQLWDSNQAQRPNIGVRTGADLAVIDADDNHAVSLMREYFNGLGINPAQVNTRRGAHFYIPVQDIPKQYNYQKLKDIPGELRAGTGAYVVAPMSVVQDYPYRFLVGSPETIRSTRTVQWQDLAVLVPTITQKSDQITEIPLRLIYRQMPDKAGDLLRWLRTANKGESITYGNKAYLTRSEAEAAVIDILALSGWNYDQISTIFDQALPAHYASVSDKKAQRERYLRYVYNSAITDLANTGLRPGIANAYRSAFLADYPSRAGTSDKAVTLALLSQGWVGNTYEPIASLRDIQEFTANIGSLATIHKALNRLKNQSLIEPVRQSVYDITKLITHLTDRYKGDMSDPHKEIALNHAPVFRAPISDGLGGSAGLIYDHLINNQNGLSVYDLVDLTGKARDTIINNLKKLESANLVGVVDVIDQKYIYATTESISKISKDFKSERYLNIMRNKHAYQRSNYQELISKKKSEK